MKVRKEWKEQKNSRGATLKYAIRGFKRHLLGAVEVVVSVAGVINFVLLLSWCFENKPWIIMKHKVSIKLIYQKNCGNSHYK